MERFIGEVKIPVRVASKLIKTVCPRCGVAKRKLINSSVKAESVYFEIKKCTYCKNAWIYYPRITV